MDIRGDQILQGNAEITGNLSVGGALVGGTLLDVTSAELDALHEAGALKADFVKLHALTASAVELNKTDGVTATPAELNLVDDLPASISFAFAAGAQNVAEATLQAKDAAGVNMARACLLLLYLSDEEHGVGLTAVAASGAVVAKAASGADFGALTAKKALLIQTKADGTYILSITDSAKTAFYVCAVPLRGGAPSVSRVMTSADYGAGT